MLENKLKTGALLANLVFLMASTIWRSGRQKSHRVRDLVGGSRGVLIGLHFGLSLRLREW
ncbi:MULTISPECIES: hypothetical protein [Bradyrhizobium]|uniref:hypothetical protein n=1 Tax=Bradyrhizobium TaxID=374 RepID=UPI00293E94FC|nr:hypothetical protein [Bradyrhizobium sp. BWC-3-1]WOH57307.1 hypothetical protein RX329_34590 [Bradyrhizobium sp. BWC-3-1]